MEEAQAPLQEQKQSVIEKYLNQKQFIIIGGLLGVIVVLIVGVLFFDNIKSLFTPSVSQEEPCENIYSNLDEAIGDKDNACGLNLAGQELNEIPNTILELENLRELDLSDNNLTSVPEDLARMPRLQKVILTGNNLSEDEKQKLSDNFATRQNGIEYYIQY